MNSSNVGLIEFARDLHRLVLNLRRTLTELSLRPIYGPPPGGKCTQEQRDWDQLRSEWRLDIEPVDVCTELAAIESQLDSLRRRTDLLLTFERDDPMPWFAEYSGEFDDLPDNYPPQELVVRWRQNPPTSLAAGVLTFAEKCFRHLQLENESDSLSTIAGHWYSVLGLITNGSKFAGWMVCELVAARSNPDQGGDEVAYYATLLQMADLVGVSKKTIQRHLLADVVGQPDIAGGKGRANKFAWSRVRPILEKEFGRQLPPRFPSDCIMR